MKVLLVQHQKTLKSTLPLGLAYVAGSLLPHGHTIDYIDLSGTEHPARLLSQRIREFAPQALGVTLWTNSFGAFQKLMEQTDIPDDVVIVAGGPHAGAAPESVLRNSRVDVIVRQEGELIAPELFEILGNGDQLAGIRGIAYLDRDGRYIQTPEGRVHQNLDSLPEIPFSLFEPFTSTGRIHGHEAVSIQTSRGCPYNCTFCYRGPAAGRKYRSRSIDKVMDDLSRFHDAYGFRAFYFMDDIFTLDRKRTIEFCRALADLPFKPLWTCMTRVDRVDAEMLQHMRSSGCISISFGVESGSPGILEHMNKGITLKQSETALRLCRKAGIPTYAFFVLGTPWETHSTYRQSVEFAKTLKPTNAIFFASTPYPGTRLREIYVERGLPLPHIHDDYSHFQEPWRTKRESASMGNVSKLCAAATREYVLFQLAGLKDYPRLLRENFRIYGLRGLAMRMSQLARLLRRK